MYTSKIKVLAWTAETDLLVHHEGNWKLEQIEQWLTKAISKGNHQAQEPTLVVLPPVTLSLPASWEPWQQLAAKYRISIIPGTQLVEGEQGKYHQAPYIDQQGQIIGQAKQTHLTLAQGQAGWQASSQLPLINTPIGLVAILLDRDCWVPEVWRLVTLAGAKLVVALTRVPAPYTEHHQLAGSWQNVQQNQVLAVECSLTGQWQGQLYQGRSALVAPCEMTPHFRGFLPWEQEQQKQQQNPDDQTASGLLDFQQLEQVRQQYPLLEQLNLSMYEDKLLPLYGQWKEVKG